MIEKIGTVVIFVFFAAFFILTGTVNEKVREWPYFVTGIGMALCALNLAMVFAREKKGKEMDYPKPLSAAQIKSVLISLCVAFVYILCASKIGFLTCTFVYITGFSYYQNNRMKKWLYPVVGLCMCVAVYVVFKILLGIPLPTGMLI